MAKDKFHSAVRRALEKENWQITHDPFPFDYGGVNFQIDIGAEQVLGAERAGEKIAVEIKSFLNPLPFTQGAVQAYQLQIIVYNPEQERIEEWNP